jgi:hypothetical protein
MPIATETSAAQPVDGLRARSRANFVASFPDLVSNRLALA